MTRLEHLKKLPLQKRLQAMENIRKTTSFVGFKEELNKEPSTKKHILGGAFVYSETRQGHGYWDKINIKYFS